MKTGTTRLAPFFLTTMMLCLLLSFGRSGFSKEAPIQIEADKMTAVDKSQTVTFTGNVDARQGDVRIRSDEMTIFYVEDEAKDDSEKQKRNAQQVEKIICTGNVEVTSVEWLGTSDTMHYFSQKNLVQLIGNAKAYQGQNMVQGERIDYHLDTGKSEVFGSKTTIESETADREESGRVNMTILEQ